MLNLDHSQELARLTKTSHLLSTEVSNIKSENWIDDEHPDIHDTIWIKLSVVPLWLVGVDSDVIQHPLAYNTLSLMLQYIKAGIANHFRLGSREEIIEDHKNLMRDVAETVLLKLAL